MISIRRASPEDAEQLTRITIAAKRHWNYPENWMQLWIPALTISPEYISENEVWVAVVDDRSVAYYSLAFQPAIAESGATTLAPHASAGEQSPTIIQGLLRREERLPRNDVDSLWLDNLWVLSEFMGQGIGRQLFHHALERSRARGESVLKIEADPNAQSFYERMGARQVGEHHGEVDGQVRVLPVMEVNVSG